MKIFFAAIRLNLFMMLLLGVCYPFVVTGGAQTFFPAQANGDLLSRGGQVLGSKRLGQKFEKPEYFWPRPSAVDYNPLPSGGSNWGPTSEALKTALQERSARLKAFHPDKTLEPPSDLLAASASGLDPHISPEAAIYQASRVAQKRGLSLDQVQKIISSLTENRQWGIFGEPVVNVLALNLALDHAQAIESAPVAVTPR